MVVVSSSSPQSNLCVISKYGQSRNSLSEKQHFDPLVLVSSSKFKVPFELIINLPKPRYERLIIERDEFGRIIHATKTCGINSSLQLVLESLR